MNDEKAMTGRELGEMLLQSVREMKAGKIGRVTKLELSTAVLALSRVGHEPERIC